MSMVVSPYRFAAGSSTPYIITLIGTTAVCWLDADQQTEANAGAVATFVDRCLNSHDFTADVSTQPVLRHAEVNGKKAVEFVGGVGGDWMEETNGLLNGATAGCYFAVIKVDADPPASLAAGPLLNKMSADSAQSHFPWTDSNVYEGFGTTARKTCGNPSPSMTSWRIVSIHSGASDYRAYMDGTSFYSTSTNTVGFGTGGGAGSGRWLCRSNPSGDHRWDGKIAEIIVCDTVLSTGDRQKVEGYLAHKYGLTANLPGGHPYISSPP